jgi:iron complex transport system substrate-binding protein
MKKQVRSPIVVAMAVLLAGALAVSGCSSPGKSGSGATGAARGPATAGGSAAGTAANGYPLTIKDDAGRSVTIAKKPVRIVSLAPANTEIVYALGLLSELKGVTTYDDYPAAATKLPKMGDFTTPNLEAIAAAKPDVILVTGGVQADIVGKLEGTGAKVVVVDPQDLKGTYAAILTVGKVLGAEVRADRVVTKMKSDAADIAKMVASAPKVRCFVEIGWDPLFTAGSGTLLDDLIAGAGGTNVVKQKGYVGYSVEQLVKDQPSVYLGTKSSIGDASALSARPGYPGLSAVKEGKVFVLDDDLVSRPGPRIVEGMREIAKALHPGLVLDAVQPL